TTSVMTRPLGRVRHEDLLVVGSRIIEDLGHVPRAIRIMDQKAQAQTAQLPVRLQQGFGGWLLEECPGLRVDRGAQEIGRRGIAYVEPNAGIERSEFHQLRRAEWSGFLRWRSGKGFLPQIRNWTKRRDAKDDAIFGSQRPPREELAAHTHAHRAFLRIPG